MMNNEPRRFYARLPIISLVGTMILGIIIGMLALSFVNNSNLPGIARLRRQLGLGTTSNSPTNLIKENVIVQENSAVIKASQKASPAVVSITANQEVADFFGKITNQEVSGGSGFIITADGLIMTNKHVVSQAGANYKVILNDGRVFDGKVQTTDPLNDLAVVKINATGLPTVELGSSDALQNGQSVLAIGNALGEFKNSVTEGIISATHRAISPQSNSGATEQLTDLIQTDAAINPGNSGGPLVNLEGQVVGINTAIASPSGGSIGIGFAIPVDNVKPVIRSVIQNGKIIRPYLGIRYQMVNPALKQALNLPIDHGALVSRGSNSVEAVVSGSPADQAGLKEGDIIASVNNEDITENNPLQRLLQKYQPGDTVNLSVYRDNKTTDISVTLGQQG